MRNFTFMILCIITPIFAFSENDIAVNIEDAKNQIEITENTYSGFSFNYNFNHLSFMEVKAGGQEFVELIVPGLKKSMNYGSPKLPLISKLIEMPEGANYEIEILSYKEKEYNITELTGNINPIIPSLPSVSKSQNEVNFELNQSVYNMDEYYSTGEPTIKGLGKLRGVNMARLSIPVFSYNPVKNILKVKYDLKVKVNFTGGNKAKSIAEKQKYYSPVFTADYNKIFNYKPSQTKDEFQNFPIKYVIVSDPAFESALQEFVNWKTRKGFHVIEAYTDNPEVGNTFASIKSYLQGLYTSATADDPAPSYVLFVGDVAQIPNTLIEGSGWTDDHVTDLYYCEYDGGNSFYPDVYYGRLSAESVSELEPQLAKILRYEKFLMSDPSYLDEVMLVAGVDQNMAPTYGNGQINYGTANYYNTAHGLTVHTYLYGSGSPVTSDDDAAEGEILQHFSNGVGLYNYTAHCVPDGPQDPEFTRADVEALTNTDKFGIMIGNCCLSNKFDDDDCFGEKIMQAPEKGVVSYIGASNSTYWDEDYWWGVGATSEISVNPTYAESGIGTYDGLWHENGEDQLNWYVTTGQMVHCGNLAVTEAGSEDEEYYWQIYHVTGDPSLMPYSYVPDELTANYTEVQVIGINSLTVNTEPGALVALSMNNVLFDSKIADATGEAILEFNPINNVGTADVVVTKQNYAPYIGTVDIVTSGNSYDITMYSVENPQTSYNCVVDMEPRVVIKNYGSEQIISANVTMVFNGNTPETIEWTGSLDQYDTTSVVFSSINLSIGEHELIFYVSSPNGEEDEFMANDTIIKTITINNNPVSIDFEADRTEFCEGPAEISFTNNSQYADNFVWDFGDGTSSTDFSVSHTYSQPGFYTVKLTGEAGLCGSDELIKTEYIVIDESIPCDIVLPQTGTAEMITTCEGRLFDNGGENANYSNNTNVTVTIKPNNADSLHIVFEMFDVEAGYNGNCNYDYLEVFDGESTSAQLIGTYCNNNLPPDVIYSTGNALTLRHISDNTEANSGFDITWQCTQTVDVVELSSQVVDIYPNPSNGKIIIETPYSNYNISIMNAIGEEVYISNIQTNKEEIDLSAYESGVYYIKLFLEDKTIVKSLIIE